MTAAAGIPSDRVGSRVPPAMAIGLGVSLLLHAGVAWWLGVIPATSRASWFPMPPAEVLPPDPDDPLRLGMDVPQNASIAWLGVLENPIEAAAPESEVEQAQLSPTPGEQPEPEPEPAPPPTEPTAEPVTEPITEPVIDPVPEPVPPPTIEPPPVTQAPPEEVPAVVPPPVTEPAEPAPPAQPEQPTIEPGPTEPEVILPVPDPREMGPPEPTPEQRAEADAAAAAEQAPPPPPVTPTPPAQPAPTRPPTPQGAPGELDERASDAAKRRTARELPIDRLGRPLQASGDLQLNTVRPTWSLQVRNAYSPRRNPFVEIRFGADGRVKLARFVPLADGTVGSGYEEVDQPLLNAVYRWTARGPAIAALDPRDPDSTHDLVMRFLLVPSVPGDRDDE